MRKHTPGTSLAVLFGAVGLAWAATQTAGTTATNGSTTPPAPLKSGNGMRSISNAQRQAVATAQRANRVALRNAAKQAQTTRTKQPTTAATLSPNLPASGVATIAPTTNAAAANTAVKSLTAAGVKAAGVNPAGTATTNTPSPSPIKANYGTGGIAIGIPGAGQGANSCQPSILDLFHCGNYANSPLPELDANGNPIPGTGIRKFVTTLAGVDAGNANELGNYIPVAKPNSNPPSSFLKSTDGPADYYQIELDRYAQQVHPDLPATLFQGYKDLNGDGKNHYLGPMIFARRDVPVRIQFKNNLPIGTAGNLFLPVDLTMKGDDASYTQNRALLHLHGGYNPWISDGTPHQWITPAGENTPNKRGASQHDVPDMASAGGDGISTWYYTNKQSSRMMWYHDHSYGLTRLNVYAGEVAPYILTSKVEDDLINGTNNSGVFPSTYTPKAVLPNQAALDHSGTGAYRYGIPLVIQDKTFVPPTAALTGTLPTPYTTDQLMSEDPTWFGYADSTGNWTNVISTADTTAYASPFLKNDGTPQASFTGIGQFGQLWFPHVFTPNQNPNDPTGVNAYGRWDYGAWVWPPVTGLTHQPIQVDDPSKPGTKITIPPFPNPSAVQEAFMDTPVVNGTPYPTLTVGQNAYRFRILNASNERHWNLQLYYAVDANGNPCNPSATNPSTAGPAGCTEVKMVPANPGAFTISTWPTDGRSGGVPDPGTVGPDIIQIGTESGFLPQPADIPSQPINYEYNRRVITALNVSDHALLIGPAERADVIFDFSKVPDGAVLILYNDAPAPDPGFDSRLDYFTNDGDQSNSGGTPNTIPGYGPNTRTVMQFVVSSKVETGAGFSVADFTNALNNGAYNAEQDAPVLQQTSYNGVLPGAAVNADVNGPIAAVALAPATRTYYDASSIPTTKDNNGNLVDGNGNAVYNLLPKAIAEEFDTDWGRMTAQLGTELPFTNFLTQTTLQQWYIDPPTEIMNNGQVQIWKITHNGVDTHSVHFHLVEVQLLNRVAWDGTQYPPDDNEKGWKEVVRLNPLTDAIIAVKPVDVTTLALPFSLPDSYRLLDVTQPEGATSAAFTNVDPMTNNPITTTNSLTNFGWEYLWHCHLLGHEENDMMRPVIMQVPPEVPGNFKATRDTSTYNVNLSWTNNAASATGFQIQRATDSAFTQNVVTITPMAAKVAVNAQLPVDNTTTYTYTDTTALPTVQYYYQVAATKLFNNQVVSNGVMAGAYASAPAVGTVPAPIAGLSATALTFKPAQALTTTSAPLSVTVMNSGTAALTLGAPAVTGDFSQTSSCTTIAPAASCTINVVFAPKATGSRTGVLTVTTNDKAHSTLKVSLSGIGTAVLVAPASITFADQNVGSTSNAAQSKTITAINEGTARLNISATLTGLNSTEFSVTPSANCTGLAAKATCTMTLKFTPAAMGTRTTNVVLSAATTVGAIADPGSPFTIPVSGNGLQAIGSLSATSLTFTTPYNTTSAPQTITLTNSGNAPLNVTGLTLNPKTNSGFTVSGCTSAVAGGSSCNLSVTFSSTANKTATLTVGASGPAMAALPPVSLSGTVQVPVLSAPSTLSFGKVSKSTTPKSSTQPVTVTNNGTAPLTIKTIVVKGTAYQLANNGCNSPIDANKTCTISVTYTPSGTVGNTQTGTLTITPAAPAAVGTVALTGTVAQ